MPFPLTYPKRKLRKMVQRGEYSQALEFGKSIEERYTEDHDFLFIMGSIYYILEEPARALPYFEQAITFQHDDIEALMLKTNTHLALKQVREAASCCMEILKINPEHEEAKTLLSQLSD